MPLSIIVVGAGIGGLSAAVSLRQAGHKVTVLERSALKRESGAAITIQANASRILLSWGVDLKKARMVTFKGIRSYKADVTPMMLLSKFDYSGTAQEFGAPYVSSHRVDLHYSLREIATAEGSGTAVEILTGSNVVAYNPKDSSVTLEDGSTLEADLIVAADGVHSDAHRYVLGEKRAPTPSGRTTVRFTIETERILANPACSAIMDAGDGQCKVYTCADGKRWLVQYPCRDNQLQNFVADRINDPGHIEDSSFEYTREGLLQRYRGFDNAILELFKMTTAILPGIWQIEDRDPLPQFHKDRLVLLGDAAHPMWPNGGQAAAAAIEDAVVLAELLRGVQTQEVIARRLEMYDSLRHSRTSAIQQFSRLPTGTDTTPKETIDRLRDYFPPGQVPKDKREWVKFVFGYDCRKETIEQIQAEFDTPARL